MRTLPAAIASHTSSSSTSSSPATAMLSLRKRTRRKLATFTTAPTRNRYALHRSGLSSSANSFSDTYSNPDTEAEEDTDTDIEPADTGKDTSLVLEHESDAELDFEAEAILNDIA
jgi:hypothetical protein